jgi:anti-sigma factor RsiW
MKRERFLGLLKSVYGAHEDEEMGCSEFFELLPRYVDVVLDASPDASAAELPQVAHHIEQCPECAEAYRALVEMAASDR